MNLKKEFEKVGKELALIPDDQKLINELLDKVEEYCDRLRDETLVEVQENSKLLDKIAELEDDPFEDEVLNEAATELRRREPYLTATERERIAQRIKAAI